MHPHGGYQHLSRQGHEFIINPPGDDIRPFCQPHHLIQQRAVRFHRQPLFRRDFIGLIHNRLAAFIGIDQHISLFHISDKAVHIG